MISSSQYLNGRVLALGARCCRFESCLADFPASVVQWQNTCFVSRLSWVRLPPDALLGGLAERFIAPVLKTGVGQPTAGSNPAPSERPRSSMDRTGGFYPPNLGSSPSRVTTCVNIDPPDPPEDDEESGFDPDDSNTWLIGPLAQWSEQSPHKGLAVGSNPTGPTTFVPIFQWIESWFPKPMMLVRVQLGTL